MPGVGLRDIEGIADKKATCSVVLAICHASEWMLVPFGPGRALASLGAEILRFLTRLEMNATITATRRKIAT
jgi:hypothetical protein